MVIQAEPIEFDDEDPRPLLRHMDQWATTALTTPEQWADMVTRAGQWADYSPRNQILLASYGIVGPVAGASTWGQVPSVEDGRECAVGTGEHSLKVRVPLTKDTDVASARTAGDGFSRSVAGGFAWEPVFAAEQLARRPHPDAMTTPSVPAMADREWSETVRKASTEIVGRRPRNIATPDAQLTALAAKAPLGANRHPLPNELANQAGWLVANRVGRAAGPMPGFDPSALRPRERWQRLEDTRKSVERVTRAVSNTMGVDLSASPLPRWAVRDDRDVEPGRRNYLSRSDVAGLPTGLWSEVGPYAQPEWEARGRPDATGRAAFLKATERSYLAVYETGGGARWALETSGRGRHLGLVAQGTADSMLLAKADARSALTERFPDVARAVDTALGSPVLSPASGWLALSDARDERTTQRVFSERVAAVVAPGPGGQWGIWMNVDGDLAQHPQLAPTQDGAQVLSEGLARGVLVGHAAVNPAQADQMIRSALGAPDSWDRSILVDVVGPGLVAQDAERLPVEDLAPAELVELLADSGRVGPETILRVLHVEGVDLSTAASLVPDVGLPIPEALNALSRTWGVGRLDAAHLVGASRDDMQQAGATLAEMLAHAPVETLRTLDTRPETWERLGPTLMESGMDAVGALRHVADHAPTPATLAVAVESITDAAETLGGRNAVTAALTVIGKRVTPDDLAAVTERFGLDPHEAAVALTSVQIPIPDMVQAVLVRVDGDTEAARGVLADSIGLSERMFDVATAPQVENVLEFRPVGSPSVNDDLLGALAQPDMTFGRSDDLVAALSEPGVETPELERQYEVLGTEPEL